MEYAGVIVMLRDMVMGYGLWLQSLFALDAVVFVVAAAASVSWPPSGFFQESWLIQF